MDVAERNELMKDYVKRFKYIFGFLELSGFCRFVIRKNKVVERKLGTMLYNICVLIVADICATYLLWISNAKEKYLNLVDFLAVSHFTIFSNLLIANITFGDKYRGLDLILNSIEIDKLLGAKETEFMRAVSIKFYKILIVCIGFTQIIIVMYMYYVFHVSVAIDVAGFIYFLWLFFAYDDFCFFVYTFSFLTARVRYLNVALIKLTNMKIEYIPKQKLFHSILWKDEFDERVTFHTRSEPKDFCVAIRMLFEQLRRIETCYRFTLVLGAVTVAVGSMVTMQTFIMYIKNPDMEIIRASAISGWSVASWFHLLMVSMQSDLFYRQLEQTKLICAYIQLKPNGSAETFRLTKEILNMLAVRDARVSVYGMFFYNTGLALTMAASTFIYMTVQLQLAFPDLKEVHKVQNVTILPDFDFNPDKVKEFWFF